MLLNKEILGGIYNDDESRVVRFTPLANTTSNFSTQVYWLSGITPVNDDTIVLEGSLGSIVNNDLPPGTLIRGISAVSSATANFNSFIGNNFILGRSGITFNSFLAGPTYTVRTITPNIVLNLDAGPINAGNSISMRGDISGSGSLTKLGTSTLSLSGNNSYTGNTYISAGLVSVLNNNPFGTGSVFCSGGSGGLFVSSNAAPENTIINNPIFIDGQRPSNGPNISVQKSATFNGLITVGPVSRTNRLNVANNATMTINGGISGGPTMGSITTMNGAGTYILSSVPIIFDNTSASPIYSDISTETVIIAVSGNRFQNIRTGGTLRTDVPFAINNDVVYLGFNQITIPRNGRINLNGNNQIFRNIQLATSITSTTFSAMSGNNIFNNSSTFANLTANNTVNSTYIGSISGNINLIKTGTSTLTLSGSTALDVGPRYTGFTAISAGALTNYALSSNPGDKVNFASFTSVFLSVAFTTPPSIGDTFILLPGPTINTYPTVSLTNGGGRTGTYNSSNSTLTIS
jgi:autotransporter-associated beta strand protein